MTQSSAPAPYTLISLGGSLLVPDDIATGFLLEFKEVLIRRIKSGEKFVIVAGGGWTARHYIEAGANVATITDEDKDWLGIHATRLNAHLLRTVFREYAHPRISTNPHDLEDFYHFKEDILVAAGWRPGFSTDYVATVLAKYLDIRTILNLTNVDGVYSADPRDDPKATRYERLDWPTFRRLIGDEWSPGLNAPFDPVASKLAEEQNLEVVIMDGRDLANLKAYFEKGPSRGTLISNRP